jgi:predicted MFS family arabinose efflux permease
MGEGPVQMGETAGALWRNRDFTLLWAGDTLSQFGSQATTIAMPLLVLFLTGSAADAGVVGFARGLGYPLSALPGGALADRVDRRRLMIACALARALAMASVAIAIALGRPPLAQLILVALADAALSTVAMIAERGLLPEVVRPGALPDAVAANEARMAVAVIGGPPLGGALYGLARGLPFAADAVSFLAVALAALGIHARPALPARDLGQSPAAAIREGLAWLWSVPFLRDGSMLYAAANLTLFAVELLGVLIARHHGASSAAVGVAFAIVGAGGVLSTLIAGWLRRRLTPRSAVLSEVWFAVICVPALLLCRSALAVGVVLGIQFLPLALSSSVVVGGRLALTPSHLRGRVQASAAFISGAVAWAGPLAIGLLFQNAGETSTVLALFGWTALVAVGGTLSRGFRQVPAGIGGG